jgi:cell fate (sporulation/competence/biofilm development) regulator YlbF (YheA/YmcA/DUF963 family)
MKKGSVPDKTADYWEEREDIDRWTASLEEQQETLKVLKSTYSAKDALVKDLSVQSKKQTEIELLQQLGQQIQEQTLEVMQLLEQAYDCQDVVLGTQKDMSDC